MGNLKITGLGPPPARRMVRVDVKKLPGKKRQQLHCVPAERTGCWEWYAPSTERGFA